MIFNLIVAGMGFIVATFDGLRTYHRKSFQSLVFTLNNCFCVTTLILADNPVWYPLVLFILYAFMIFLVIEDAHRVVHSESGEQKLWNTLRGWFYLSLAYIFDVIDRKTSLGWTWDWFEHYYVVGFCYAYAGYFPPKIVSWEDVKREFGLDLDDETDDNKDED